MVEERNANVSRFIFLQNLKSTFSCGRQTGIRSHYTESVRCVGPKQTRTVYLDPPNW